MFGTLALQENPVHPDQQYINALQQHDAAGIAGIYQRFAPGIKAYLQSKGALAEEAGDVFQEALVDIYKLASDGSFVLTCPFEAFLLLVCKRKWINLAKKSSRREVTIPAPDAFTGIADPAAEAAADAARRVEQEQLVVQMLEQISERCREIILGAYSYPSQQALAQKLGVSYAYLRKKKSACLAELIALVKNKQSHEPL